MRPTSIHTACHAAAAPMGWSPVRVGGGVGTQGVGGAGREQGLNDKRSISLRLFEDTPGGHSVS